MRPSGALARHVRGDWGSLPALVACENECALTDGRPVLSCYTAHDGTTFWVVTDGHRIVTTVLLDDEYFGG